MPPQPFVSLPTQENLQASLCVPSDHAGFALGQEGRRNLECGTHALQSLSPAVVFLVRVGASHVLELTSLGNSMLRNHSGQWQPLRVIGHLEYSIAQPERLMDALERDAILEASEFERELRRIVLDRVSSFLECDTWRAETLSASLECASGELQIHLEAALDPLGIQLQSFELSTNVDAVDPSEAPHGLA